VQAAFAGRRGDFGRGLQRHDINIIIADVTFEFGRKAWPLSVLDGDEVFDPHCIHHLAAESFSGDAGADALARRIDGCSAACRATADDEHFKRFLCRNGAGDAGFGAGVELGDDLLQLHSALAEQFAVQEHGGDCHYFPRVDLVLEQCAVDGGVGDARVEHRHQVQRLHDIRAVLAGLREITFERVVPIKLADLIKQRLRCL